MTAKNPATFAKVVSQQLPGTWATGTDEGAAIDTQGWRYALVILHAGTATATGTATVTVEECATSGGSYTAISNAAFAVVNAANEEALFAGIIDLHKTERYIHVQAVVATDTVDLSTSVVLMQPEVGGLTFGTAAFDV